jgi:mannose-1-phosphate guanylyltransferase/MurNAc alpha-1-phosphate uridylyltransferase
LYEQLWQDTPDLDLVTTDAVAIDCGTPPRYLRANLHASGGASVIGQGAVVRGELVRSVAWPGARVAPGERLVESIRVGSNLTVEARQQPDW